MMVLRVAFLAALCFSQGVYAQFNPLKDPSICGRPKCPPGGKFKYNKHIEYKYDYSVEIRTLFAGSSPNESSLYVQAVATLEFPTKCEGSVQFTDVWLLESAPKINNIDNDNEEPTLPKGAQFAESIQEHALRFSFHDGTISEVCPDDKEPNWVLNFKKGFLSAIQNTMARFDMDHNTIETDVAGTCETAYALEGARETSLVVVKTKNLSSCKHRYKHHSILQTTPYTFREDFQAWPILRSTSKCQLSVDHNIYNSISCEERHVFQPFSNNDAGGTTIAKQVVTLVSETNITVSEFDEDPEIEPIRRRSNLLFDQVPTPKPTHGELKASRDLLKQLCRLGSEDIHREYTDVFTIFIGTARALSHTALAQVLNRATSICSTGKKHMLDALPFLGSSASVQLMRDVIIHKDKIVDDDTAREWMLRFAFIPRPDTATLEAMLPLLEYGESDAAFALSVSAVAHTFCRNNKRCISYKEVDNIVRVLQARVTSYRDGLGDRKHIEHLLVSLKALGNIGVVTDDFGDTLIDIIEYKAAPTVVRVAAVEVHRRLPCLETREYFVELLRNLDSPSELRIASYLQAMRCPNYLVIRTIKHALQVEEVNQVGSFIWSHLHNLARSANPARVEAQGLLTDRDLGRKFNSDARKFSRNYESSVFFDEYNAGGSFESNIIFSPDSYIPRSASMNLTVDLFGESVNLFEVNARTEGFEHYVEAMFGPQGPLSSENVQNGINKQLDKLSKFRFARDAKPTQPDSSEENLKKSIDDLPYKLPYNYNQPKASLGLKVFGNDVKYLTFEGDEEVKTAVNKLNPAAYVRRLLSGKEISFKKAGIFMDTSYTISTCAGLPLSLQAVGSAAMDLRMVGALKAADFFNTTELDLQGSLKPSVTVDVVGTMQVDAYFASTGIKLKTNLYSSSAIEGVVKVRGARLISAQFSLPKDKTEIFSVKSELIVMKNDEEHPQAGVPQRARGSSCSWPALDKALGLKVCLDFTFPNVTKIVGAPSFLLSGPINFTLDLQKADLTAKKYHFEYKWVTEANCSHVSVLFDTPGSAIERLLSANMTMDGNSKNLTMLFKSSEDVFMAQGHYRNTKDEIFADLTLDINDQKHFNAQFGWKAREQKNGFVYTPRMYLAVNNERVAELSGTLKVVQKKSIALYDVNLIFQTKRLSTKLLGYITSSEASIAAKLKLDYQFQNGKPETLKVEAGISNRSGKSRIDRRADLHVESSAYPQFNFISSLTYQSAMGHIECKIEINTSENLRDPNHTLTLHLVLVMNQSVEGIKHNAYVAVTKPVSNLDVKVQLKYDRNGIEHNGLVLIRYGPRKEIISTLSLTLPRGILYQIEGKLNITVPSFVPMVIEGSVKEKHSNEYMVIVSGTWFSGHSLTAQGFYTNNSTSKISNHYLKLHMKSPSFNEIDVNMKFYHDRNELRLDAQVDHSKDHYGLLLKHVEPRENVMTSYAEVRYKTKLYSVSSQLHTAYPTQLLLEFHLDQMRDIHIAIRGVNGPLRKEFGFEVKWDANRDPSQKVVASIEFLKTHDRGYSTAFIIGYPGRTVNGALEVSAEEHEYSLTSRLAWSTKDAISLKVRGGYKGGATKDLRLKIELLTPFEHWTRTALEVGILQHDNLLHANGSALWEDDQQITLDLFGDYEISSTIFRCEFNSSMSSTVADIPSLTASLRHSHKPNNLDTTVYIKYNPNQVISVVSSWIRELDGPMRVITGSVTLATPFQGYHRGLLVSKISISQGRDINGLAELDLDNKKYTLSMEGHMKKITNNMLEFNITTPIAKYSKVKGRFGFSEEKRHFVAEVLAPQGSVGLEMLFAVVSSSDFDVKLHLATPLEFLNKILLVAKLKKDTADFRVGWNKLVLGFTGVWNFKSATNFEYSYTISTPIDGIEESGIVAKLIHEDGLDFEVSMRLSDKKLGLTIFGKPKPKPLYRELGLKRPLLLEKIESKEDSDETEADDDDEDEDEESTLSWSGLLELDTLVYPTMKGTLDLEEFDSIYSVSASLTLPEGEAELRDDFEMIDYFNMRNRLQVTTPIPWIKEVTSNYDFSIDLGYQYTLNLDLNIRNNSEWIKTGILLNYTSVLGDEDSEFVVQTHDALFRVHTPLASIPRLQVRGLLEVEKNAYRANFTALTNSSRLSVAGNLEVDNSTIEAGMGLDIKSPHLTIPMATVAFKKDFSEVENRLEFGLDFIESDVLKKFKLETVWHVEGRNYLKAKVKLQTPLEVLSSAECSVLLSTSISQFEAPFVDVVLQFSYRMYEVRITARRKEEDVNFELISPLQKFRNVTLVGTLTALGEDTEGPRGHSLKGVLRSGEDIFHVAGTVVIYNGLPVQMDLILTPTIKGETGTIKYALSEVSGGHTITARLERGATHLNIQGGAYIRNGYNWNVDLKIDSSEPVVKHIEASTKMEARSPGSIMFDFKGVSPWTGFETSNLGIELLILNTTGSIAGSYGLSLAGGKGSCAWTWIFKEDMRLSVYGSIKPAQGSIKSIYAATKFINPGNKYRNLTMGADLAVNDIWKLGANCSLYIPSRENVAVDVSVQLPPPSSDLHRVLGRYTSANKFHNIDYTLKYITVLSERNYGSTGKMVMLIDPSTRQNITQADLQVHWGPNVNTQSVANKLLIKKGKTKVDLNYNLLTPKYSEDTIVLTLSYDNHTTYHNLSTNVHMPASRHLGSGAVNYITLDNMNGHVNSSTPMKGLPWLAANFNFISGRNNIRFLEVFWTNNSALVDSKYSYNTERDVEGTVLLEIPLTTRHICYAVYGYQEKPLLTTGHATLQYNNKTFLDGKYSCKSEISAHHEKDTVDILLENKHTPVGVKYIHLLEHKAEGYDISDTKRAEVFHLHNRTGFNVTGELHVKTSSTGQRVELIAVHTNRTVKISTEYDLQDLKLEQRSKIQLAPDIWFAYDLQLLNMTKSDVESQQFVLELAYPRRNLSASGSYKLTTESLNSDVTLLWDKAVSPRTVSAALDWRQIPGSVDRQEAVFTIKHPSFVKDVTFRGELERGAPRLVFGKFLVEYCDDPEKLLTLTGEISDLSTDIRKAYMFEVLGSHPGTRLDLAVRGDMDLRPGLYTIVSDGQYKRSYLPLQKGDLKGRIDISGQEIEFQKKNMMELSRLWARAGGAYPVYTANGTLIHGPNLDANGEFYLNLNEKLMKLEVNMTPDATQSLHMYGTIPDARSASFDLWRDYEDIRVADVSYYLRLNHSRLVTSQLLWRPALNSDIKGALRGSAILMYDSISEGIDYWRQYIRSEMADAINDIWLDAKPYTQGFLDDMGGLSVLENDLEEFRHFLNESYNANDFYVRDIVAFTMYVVDELSIRSHIESLPAIVNEIWEVMGESGQAVRKSLLWIIETIKTSYKKAVELLTDLLHGDSMSQVTALLERIVAKYDKFIKDIHVAFIKYVEELWIKLSDFIQMHWKKTLQAIEPSFIKLLHYFETMVVRVGREVLDFLYIRTNEIVESAYFSKASEFTQDLDKFYKDITGNDAVTNIRKYSDIVWRFLKEKYFTLVPFGKELQELVNEILNELKQLQNLPSIKFIIQKYEEVYAKAKWFYEYFDIGDRLRHVFNLVQMKITDIAQTALQAENRYREAKTKFVFDPETGIMKLEQKLPMSWHAFNETPKFEEIPEYKAISDIQNYFVASNTTFWTFYNEYKPYTEPSTWLPPFKAHALLIGTNHFVTFDRRFIEFSGECSYLLAHDFLDGNFSLALGAPQGDQQTRRFSLVAGGQLIKIDIFNNSVRLGSDGQSFSRLPVSFKDAVIYQEADILYVESKLGYALQCNLHFDVCILKLSGWYFGKTAGLLGTMNNEPRDDLMTSWGTVESGSRWANSWSLEGGGCHVLPKPLNHTQPQQAGDVEPAAATQELCDSFFRSKVSHFSACFAVVDPTPFYGICLNSRSSASGPCSSAVAYLQACAIDHTPLRIPDTCVKCSLSNGTEIPEGSFVTLKGKEVPRSSDIVFIIEAKMCNANLTAKKNIQLLSLSINKEFSDLNITNNRFAAVVFGGVGSTSSPRSVVVNDEIFTTYQNLPDLLDHIVTGEHGSNDIFEAIGFASRLVFRPGVSKTFVLMPCSKCDPQDMRLDYSAVHQLLVESGVKLHVLMDDDFHFDKTRVNKVFYGMDSQTAYTRKDVRLLKGDAELRRQVRLPKTTLGFCTPLALEINGTLFSGRKMEGEKKNAIKKFFTVFSKRVALTAVPATCQSCECTAHNTGVAYTLCYPCDYPTPGNVDYGFNDDLVLSILQPDLFQDEVFDEDDSADISS